MGGSPCIVVVQFDEIDLFDRADAEAEFERLFGRCADDLERPECYGGCHCGGGTAEFFVLTHNPVVTWQRLEPRVRGLDWRAVRLVAWKEVEDDSYAVLWPAGYSGRWTPSEPDDDADKVFEDHPELRDYEEP
jgi:hypothetical protein